MDDPKTVLIVSSPAKYSGSPRSRNSLDTLEAERNDNDGIPNSPGLDQDEPGLTTRKFADTQEQKYK